jgi:hypothetical protein
MFSFTHTGSEKFSTAIAIPTVSEEKKRSGTFPTARINIAKVRITNAIAITRLVPPILPMSGMSKALAANARTESDVRKERRKELR